MEVDAPSATETVQTNDETPEIQKNDGQKDDDKKSEDKVIFFICI